jgi:hypothetical protein
VNGAPQYFSFRVVTYDRLRSLLPATELASNLLKWPVLMKYVAGAAPRKLQSIIENTSISVIYCYHGTAV